MIRTDYRWYKKPYMDESAFARPEIKEEVAAADEELKGEPITSAYLSSKNRENYIGLIKNIRLPPYWSEQLSTMHRRLTQQEIDERTPIWQRWKLF